MFLKEKKSDRHISSFLHRHDSLIDLYWFQLILFPFSKMKWAYNSISFDPNLSSQHFSLASTYFEDAIGISLSLLKWFLSAEFSLGNVNDSQLGSQVKESEIWLSPGAILTISPGDLLGLSTLYMTVGKSGEDLFNFLFLSLSSPSILSSLSVWLLLLDP